MNILKQFSRGNPVSSEAIEEWFSTASIPKLPDEVEGQGVGLGGTVNATPRRITLSVVAVLAAVILSAAFYLGDLGNSATEVNTSADSPALGTPLTTASISPDRSFSNGTPEVNHTTSTEATVGPSCSPPSGEDLTALVERVNQAAKTALPAAGIRYQSVGGTWDSLTGCVRITVYGVAAVDDQAVRSILARDVGANFLIETSWAEVQPLPSAAR